MALGLHRSLSTCRHQAWDVMQSCGESLLEVAAHRGRYVEAAGGVQHACLWGMHVMLLGIIQSLQELGVERGACRKIHIHCCTTLFTASLAVSKHRPPILMPWPECCRKRDQECSPSSSKSSSASQNMVSTMVVVAVCAAPF